MECIIRDWGIQIGEMKGKGKEKQRYVKHLKRRMKVLKDLGKIGKHEDGRSKGKKRKAKLAKKQRRDICFGRLKIIRRGRKKN